ncbi:MAG: MBL fold metallo-hydrolase [marine benthic group bacterium]|jgi:ribonuclease Z|nr:MBL fold metallo-hydrolase [Gemmatimonadota bacterium]MCL7990776.1 MBL fold metallo-hydrolase [Gemmatimonadota bacterium]
MRRLLKVVAAVGVIALLAVGYFVFTERGQDLLLEKLTSAAAAGTFPPAVDGLRVLMCGTASPMPAKGRAQACVAVIAGDRMFVVDAGAGSAGVATAGRTPLEDLSGVLLTHFHSDHIAALYDFNLNSWVAGRSAPLTVMGPVGVDEVVEGMNDAYALDRGYRVAHHGAELLPPELGVMQSRVIEPGVVLEEAGLRITAFPVNHAPVDPAVGYRFEYRGRSVAVSGDAVVDDGLRQGVQGVDLLLQDAISLPIVTALERANAELGIQRMERILHDIQDYHAPTGSLDELVDELGVSMLAIYHLVPPPPGTIMKRIFRRDLPPGALLTEDGMIFDLPADSDKIVVR